MTEEITSAFLLWRQFINSNRDNPNPGLIVFHDLAKRFQVLAIEADLDKIFEIGSSYGFAPGSIINMLVLHSAYFMLL